MSTDVSILNKYLLRIAEGGGLSNLSLSELFDMRDIASRVKEAVERAGKELRKQGIDPNTVQALLDAGDVAKQAGSHCALITFASELTVRGAKTAFTVTKYAVIKGLPLAAAAALGSAATYVKMGGSIPGLSA